MDTTSVRQSNGIKQVIAVRKDLDCRRGKLYSQVAHASMAFITRRLGICCNHPTAQMVRLSPVEQRWLDESFTKICVSVNSEEELFAIASAAEDAGIATNVVVDNGLTEFGGIPTPTCVALGPDYSHKIDPITRHLSLL